MNGRYAALASKIGSPLQSVYARTMIGIRERYDPDGKGALVEIKHSWAGIVLAHRRHFDVIFGESFFEGSDSFKTEIPKINLTCRKPQVVYPLDGSVDGHFGINFNENSQGRSP